MNDIELKPCPFCGQPAELVDVHVPDCNGGRYYVHCPTCSSNFSFMPGLCVRTYTGRTPEDVAALWNHRAKVKRDG